MTSSHPNYTPMLDPVSSLELIRVKLTVCRILSWCGKGGFFSYSNRKENEGWTFSTRVKRSRLQFVTLSSGSWLQLRHIPDPGRLRYDSGDGSLTPKCKVWTGILGSCGCWGSDSEAESSASETEKFWNLKMYNVCNQIQLHTYVIYRAISLVFPWNYVNSLFFCHHLISSDLNSENATDSHIDLVYYLQPARRARSWVVGSLV